MTTFGSYQDSLLQHNSNIASPSVIHNHLAGRTNIADHTTEKPILADATGHLKVQLHDDHSGHLNNTGGIGDGTTVLRTVDLGYDRANGQGRSKLVDSAGRQVVNLTGNSATDGTGTNYHIKADSGGHALVDLKDIYSGAGNNNIGEGSTKLQIFNYGRDVSAGNYKPMVVNSSAEQIVALSSVDNAVLDTIATNTANIKVSTDSVNLNVDGLETLVGATNTALGTIETDVEATNTLLTTIDGVLDTIKTDSSAIKTAVELLDNCVAGNELQVDIVSGGGGDASASNQSTMITHLSEIEGAVETIEGCVGSSKVNVNISSGNISGFATETTLGNAEAHLGNIDTGVDVLEACVGSNKVNVNISSGNISGFATESTLGDAETHLGNIETKLGTLETDVEATNTLLGTIDGVLDNAEAHLGNIDTGVDVLEACVGSNKVNVNISSGNISGFATETTLGNAEAHLGNIDTGVDVLEACVGSNKVNVNISSDGSGLATQSTLADAEAHLGNIDTGVDVLEACVGSNKVNVNISSGNISGFATESTLGDAETHLGNIETKLGTIETDIEATNTLLTTLDGVQDNALTKLGEIDTAIDTMDAVVDAIKVKTDILGSLTTTRTQNGVTIAGSGTNTSSAIELTHNPHSITIFCRSSSGSIGGSSIQISPLMSMDDSNYFDLLEVVDGGGAEIFMTKGAFYNEAMVVVKDARFKYLKVKITNLSGTSADFTAHVSF